MFENRYTITKKLYVDWAVHPVMLGGQTHRRGSLLTLLVLAASVAGVVFGAIELESGGSALLLVISLIVLSLNLFGDGLRDAFDPKLNS